MEPILGSCGGGYIPEGLCQGGFHRTIWGIDGIRPRPREIKLHVKLLDPIAVREVNIQSLHSTPSLCPVDSNLSMCQTSFQRVTLKDVDALDSTRLPHHSAEAHE